MMADCWVLTASHEGPVSARPLASRGVRSDRPGETPVESASQCGGAVGLPVPAVEPGISRLTLAGDRASSADRQKTISQIPPNTAKAPIRSVGWELSNELLTWHFSGAPLRNRTVDLLLTMHTSFV